uniref:Uncharacterized protein n=1 Tax=Musca domestica TaxID=7370 RepID=A0A1I8M5C0_MUSDO
MEFLRGVYAFMQVSRSSVDYQQGFESITTTAEVTTPLTEANATTITTTGGQTTEIPTTIRGSSTVIGKKQNQETSLSLKTTATASNGLEENPKRSIAKKSLKQIKETPEEEQSQ